MVNKLQPPESCHVSRTRTDFHFAFAVLHCHKIRWVGNRYATTCTQQCSDQGEETVQKFQTSFSLCDIAF